MSSCQAFQNRPKYFHAIASTGRTATTFISQALSSLSGVTALHEGHSWEGAEKSPVLPLINLENNQCYKSPDKAASVIRNKRNARTLSEAMTKQQADVLIDVAYYYPALIQALLEENPKTHVLGIIRDCESFVRSAARVHGEDIMAVGWPDPDKALTSREKFISMGRIRPKKSAPEFSAWTEWGTIERNIWLWRETNGLILQAKSNFPDRVHLLSFEKLKSDPNQFWNAVLAGLNIPKTDATIQNLASFIGDRNRKSSQYQIPSSKEWNEQQNDMLKNAESYIQKIWSS